MCSSQSNEDPTTYDAPIPSKPRVYRLSGDRPRASIALAVLGEMLTEAEDDLDEEWGLNSVRIRVLRQARDAVAAAESAE